MESPVPLQADGAPALFWGDVVHHPVQLIRLDLPSAFDMDPVAASALRQANLARAAQEQTLSFPATSAKARPVMSSAVARHSATAGSYPDSSA